ncbi:sensor domain-containing diguanylate cyclase [Desulfomicrobium escambiense]|uniref:sensor domain-containing diguanylate cyclase n=1 Tax=Desulfomicrobium escambiense TaxID=29503 RepID=UPI0003FD90B3|nr:sensor domain-containing diguanylate cyclase [Desulfomicrobium escambiense]
MESQTASSCIQVLLEIARGTSHRASIQKTLSDICGSVERYFAPRHLAALLVEPETGDLTFTYVAGDKAELLGGKKLRKGKGVAGWVASGGEPLLVEDADSDPRFPALFLTAKTKGCKSLVAVPLKSGDAVYGVLEMIDTRSGGPFTAKHLQDFSAMAEIISLVLEKAYYFQAMKRMAETDLLTGLANKRTFDRHMEREIEVCKRYGIPSSVVLLKIENLRKLNEDHGTISIDRVLQLVATVLKEEIRKVDVPCRIKADTFAVIMPNTLKVPAIDVGNRLSAKISQQSAARQMPYFSLALETLSAVQDDVVPVLGICEACRNEPQGFRKFRDVGSNLFQMFSEEKQATERRQYYRKDVQLAGSFTNTETGETGDFLVDNVSLNGLGFTTLLGHRLNKNELLNVTFRLDDSRRSEINRVVRVRYMNDRYVGCQFTDQRSYDTDLGFYLMR